MDGFTYKTIDDIFVKLLVMDKKGNVSIEFRPRAIWKRGPTRDEKQGHTLIWLIPGYVDVQALDKALASKEGPLCDKLHAVCAMRRDGEFINVAGPIAAEAVGAWLNWEAPRNI